jgi:hypothetical protein
VRSSQGAGDYVEYYSALGAQSLAGWDQAGYRSSSAWQPAVVMGTAPLPNPPACGNYSEPTGHNVAPATPATATGTPVLESPCGLVNLIPLQAPVTYKIVHPVSVDALPDGTVEADFGYAFVGVPVVRFPGSTSAQQDNGSGAGQGERRRGRADGNRADRTRRSIAPGCSVFSIRQ